MKRAPTTAQIAKLVSVCLLACWIAPMRAATGTIMPSPFQTALDNSGKIINNAKICVYIAGTSTLATTYSDSALTTPNTNPIRSDSAGRFVAYLTPGTSYKFTYQDSTGTAGTCDGVTLKTVDNIAAIPASAATVDVTGTAGEAISAGQCAYLSDGSGSKTQGLWYKCDSANAYSSTTNWVGLTPSAIASAASGTIRLGGSLTGLSSLSVGSIYYAGTSGALTTTAPSNARKVGQADTATSLVVMADPPAAAGPTVDNTIVDGRLTLTTAVPVTTADVTGATNIYFTPFKGNRIALYDGSAWNVRTFSEITIALGTLTSGLPYDIFCYDNAGTVACDAPLAWTNGTTRATALVLQDGVLSKTGALTRRYMGSFYTTSTTQTEDSAQKRYLWNYYNRQARMVRRLETTATWTYTTATWRQANASTTNQIELMNGYAESPLDLRLAVNVYNNTGAVSVNIAIGAEDSTTTAHASSTIPYIYTVAVNSIHNGTAHLSTFPALGRHFYAWLEYSAATGMTTWSGDSGTGLARSGLEGTWWS